MLDASSVLGECAESMMASAWIGKFFGERRMRCPVLVGGALNGIGTVVDDCSRVSRYVLCEVPSCREAKLNSLAPKIGNVLLGQNFTKAIRQDNCAGPSGGVNIITDLVTFGEAAGSCSSVDPTWALMDVTSANIADLAAALNSCFGSQLVSVWVNSYNGLGIPTGQEDRCGLLDVNTGADGPVGVEDIQVGLQTSFCDAGQFVACQSTTTSPTTSTGSFSTSQSSTTTDTETNTLTFTTTSNLTTLRFTTTVVTTLPSTTTTTSTSQSFSVTITLISPP